MGVPTAERDTSLAEERLGTDAPWASLAEQLPPRVDDAAVALDEEVRLTAAYPNRECRIAIFKGRYVFHFLSMLLLLMCKAVRWKKNVSFFNP